MTDEEGISKLALALYSTNAFKHVYEGIYPAGPDPTLTSPSCWIHPTKWSTKEDDGDDPVRYRTVNFVVQLYSTALGNQSPDQLAETIQKTLHGMQFLASTECRCESGDYHKYGGMTKPTHILTVIGLFKYIVT